MSAGHRDRSAPLHDRTEACRTRPEPQPAALCFHDLNVVRTHSGRGDDRVNVGKGGRVVTDVTRDAFRPQGGKHRRVDGIAAAHDDALLDHQTRDG